MDKKNKGGRPRKFGSKVRQEAELDRDNPECFAPASDQTTINRIYTSRALDRMCEWSRPTASWFFRNRRQTVTARMGRINDPGLMCLVADGIAEKDMSTSEALFHIDEFRRGNWWFTDPDTGERLDAFPFKCSDERGDRKLGDIYTDKPLDR